MEPLFPDPERGPYFLLEPIGKGGASEVWRARAMGGRYVCIKRLAARWLTEECKAETREEARLLQAVRHPNVIALEATGDDGTGAPYLVLELVRGVDLARFRGERWDVGLAAHVACAVLRALAVVRRAAPGLVHRDVSPHNVLVSRDGEVKLADFGIALTEGRARWTMPGFVKGKIGYMAPEQIVGEPVDARADLFSVGVLLYELLCGVRPCHPERGMRELFATANGAWCPLKIRAPHAPEALCEAVNRLLARDRAARFETAERALAALAPFVVGDHAPAILAAAVRTRAHNGSEDSRETDTISMETAGFHG